MWMLQIRGELDLLEEALGAEDREQLSTEPLRLSRCDDLDHDIATECLVARDEHARHAAALELALERVGRSECGLELVAEEVGHDCGWSGREGNVSGQYTGRARHRQRGHTSESRIRTRAEQARVHSARFSRTMVPARLPSGSALTRFSG